MNSLFSRACIRVLNYDCFHGISDERYLKIVFHTKMGKRLDLDNPKTLNEKLQWLKLNEHDDKFTQYVDKLAVRDYVAKVMGEDVLVPLLNVWDRFDEIDFDTLPEQFVLKCNHDSGSTIICRDKATFNLRKTEQKINRALSSNYYYIGREWPYKNVRPRIIAEKYIDMPKGSVDYKVYCFNSEPQFIVKHTSSNEAFISKMDFYDTDWDLMPVRKTGHSSSDTPSPRPQYLHDMLRYAHLVSVGVKFLRVDFYEASGHLYFGELTFFPSSGFNSFEPEEYDRIFGDMLEL